MVCCCRKKIHNSLRAGSHFSRSPDYFDSYPYGGKILYRYYVYRSWCTMDIYEDCTYEIVEGEPILEATTYFSSENFEASILEWDTLTFNGNLQNDLNILNNFKSLFLECSKSGE